MKLILIFIFIFHTGNGEDKLEIGPVNGTFVVIGSRLTFTCVTPCNSSGNASIEFAEFSKSFITPCHGYSTENSRMVFSCDVCEYKLQIQEIQKQDHQKHFTCTFEPNDGNLQSRTTYINVIGKTVIIPLDRLYTDGERVQFHCLLYGNNLTDGNINLTLELSCHGKEIYMDSQEKTATINLTIDIDYNGTKCTCAVYDDDNVLVKSEMTLNISLYHPVLKLSPQFIVPYGNSVTLTCTTEGLTYPFRLGNWLSTGHNEEHQWTVVTPTPSSTEVTINNSRNSTSLIFHNITYKHMGRFQCMVVDLRKSNLVVGNSTTRLMVEGPIFLDGLSSQRHKNNCKITAVYRSFPKIVGVSWWKDNKRVKAVAIKTGNMMTGDEIRQNYSSDFFSCFDNATYGLIGSNKLFTARHYFNSAGTILKSSPILQVHGKLIDGHQISVECYEISLTNASYLSLICDNINDTTSRNLIGDNAPVQQLSFIADVDDMKVCNCINKRTGESEAVDIQIKHYHPVLKLSTEYKVAYGNHVTLTCTAESLTYPFEFDNWLYKSHNEEHQWTEVTQTPSSTAVTINNTSNSTLLMFQNAAYKQMGRYQCTVVDRRKSNLVVANLTTQLIVEGPIFLDGLSSERLDINCKIQASFRSFPNITVISLWENYYRLKDLEMKEVNIMKGDLFKHNYSSDPFSCSDNVVYGLVASNELTTTKRYFNSAGTILQSTLVLRVHGKLIDGHQISVECFEISLTNASYLSLMCDNINDTTSRNLIGDHAPVQQISFIADVDDMKVCNCSNKRTGESEATDIQIKLYKSVNATSSLEKCNSSSKITLKCSYNDLPDSFVLNGWIHQLKGVNIRELDGSPNGKENVLHIPFCTYEDTGNYICIVADIRKNKTILNSTIYLDVPGPPVIVNFSVVKLGGRQGCSLNVSFYSFDDVFMTAWYKNGKQLISSEHMKQGLEKQKHYIPMHGSFVPIDSYVASLEIKPKCDVEDNVYNFTTYTAVYKASRIFRSDDDNPVRKVLIVSMVVATGIFVAGLNVTICKAYKMQKEQGDGCILDPPQESGILCSMKK